MAAKNARNIANDEKLKALLSKAEDGIREFLSGDKYRDYLHTMSQFHRYSFRNCALIAMQRPDATYVAGYQAWQKKFKRQVRRGERGIQIVGVSIKNVDLPQERKDANGQPVFDENGEKIIDTVTKKHASFFPTYVWDVSQTEGEPLPELSTELDGLVNGYANLMASIEAVSEYEISFREIDGSAKGYCSHAAKQIVIQKDMPEAQTVKTAIHELAHSVMHDPNSKLNRATKEVQAESVAFVVCDHYGIDTSDYSFPYVATWSSTAELKELQDSMDAIQRAANSLIEKIDKRFAELQIRELGQPAVETGKDLTEGAGYKIFYGGSGGQDKEAHDFQKETGWKMVWGSESDGLNGDTYIVYRSMEDVPAPLQKTVQRLDKVFYGNREDLSATEEETLLTEHSDNIRIAGHTGTWYVINAENIAGIDLYLLESEQHGDEAANLIVDSHGNLLLEDVYNGFEDYREQVLDDQQEISIPRVGDMYEYVGNIYEVIDIADNLIYLQSVNDDRHHEIDYSNFVRHPELYIPTEKIDLSGERNPVLIPEDPPKTKYRVTIQFPGKAEPVVSITEAASRADLEKGMAVFADVGATVLRIEDMSEDPEPVTYRAKIQSIYEHEIVHELPDELRLTYFDPQQGVTCAKLAAGVSEKRVGEKYDEICAEREKTHARFETLTTPTFSIYQLRADAPSELHFEGYENVVKNGHAISLDNYSKIYTAPFEAGTTLEDIYQRFNINHPADFTGHSLSVSDIVAVDYPGSMTAHYVDRFGYTPLPEISSQLLMRKQAETRREEAFLDTVRYDGELDMDKESSRKPIAERLFAAKEVAAQRNAARAAEATTRATQDERGT